ncbi:MAG: hypothetical protein K8F25_13015 [Fimbriimonadaceae bacterium]|nr:hypothetical protein [Alphaproteobacteria bacterium]
MTERGREAQQKEVIVANGTGGAGWFVAILLLVILLIAEYVFRDTILGNGQTDVNISVDVPEGNLKAE